MNPYGADGEMEPDDRLRLTALNWTWLWPQRSPPYQTMGNPPFQGTMTDLRRHLVPQATHRRTLHEGYTTISLDVVLGT